MQTRQHIRSASIVLSAFLVSQAAGQSVDRLWTDNCMKCHGKAGEGGGAGTKTLLTLPQLDESLDRAYFDAIKNGVKDNGMDAFGETMTNQQIWGLVVYIRELQSKALSSQLRPASKGDQVTTKLHNYVVEEILKDGFDVPWSLKFLPDGRMIITDRDGDIRLWTPDAPGSANGKLSEPVQGTPQVLHHGQGGLMDVALHPDRNGWIYLAFNHQQGEGRERGMTKIVRGKLEEKGEVISWVDEEVIFEAAPEHANTAGVHFGSRIVFSPTKTDGKYHVFFAIGERGKGMPSQKPDSPVGKIHRLWEDGSVPTDNPFVGTPGALPSVWSLGHRNPQGLVFHPSGQLWSTEHAPRGGDEVNLIERGANYGWPVVSYGINYNGAPFRSPWTETEGGETAKLDITMPAMRWLPSIGACGLDVYKAGATGGFPSWNGDLLAGGLSGQNVDRLRVEGGKVVEREVLFAERGRVRDVLCGPDGFVYIILNDPGRIVRLVPASSKN